MVNTEIRLSIFFTAKDGEALNSQPKQDLELTGSDHELLTAKFRLNLKKGGKTTRPFRYDLNQLLYDYTVEVMNRFKLLDLVDRVPEELWTEVHNMLWEVVTKTTQSGSLRRQENSRKTSISALLTMPKLLTVWITINCGKF